MSEIDGGHYEWDDRQKIYTREFQGYTSPAPRTRRTSREQDSPAPKGPPAEKTPPRPGK